MLNRTERTPLSIENRNPVLRPQLLPAVPSAPLAPRSTSSYFTTGILLGFVFGFALGALATLVVGDKSLLFAQHLWNRVFNVDTEGEKVHFEWLLQ
jgi:hypothetical protein